MYTVDCVVRLSRSFLSCLQPWLELPLYLKNVFWDATSAIVDDDGGPVFTPVLYIEHMKIKYFESRAC